jgi:hypothetical protein
MKGLFILFCLSLSASLCTAQTHKHKAENRINLTYTPQWYLNQGGVFNDGNYPDIISAKNTMGYVAGLEYERVTKGGIIMNVGFLYGRQSHDVEVMYKSLEFFDDMNQEQLKQTHNEMNYSANVGYIGMKFMAGYRWIIPATFLKGWALEGKAGFSFRISTTQSNDNILWRINYQRNDTLYLTQFGQDVVSFGKKSRLGSMAWSHNADLYLGLNKSIHWGFVKNISFGITATYGIGGKYKGIGNVESLTYNLRQKVISRDEYRNQNFSLGLRFAVGLWPSIKGRR